MASKTMLVLLAIATVVLPQVALAMDYTVGEDKGWGLKVNYTEWAADKEFFVGDQLVFKYDPNSHNLYNVTGPDFKNCNVPKGSQPRNSGSDVITLLKPGKKWYICGMEGHCGQGQKLVINVQSQGPSPQPQSRGTTISTGLAMMIAVFVIAIGVFF